MYFLGYGAFGRIMERLLDLIIAQIDERYETLKTLIDQLNKEEHIRCLDTQCRKVSQSKRQNHRFSPREKKKKFSFIKFNKSRCFENCKTVITWLVNVDKTFIMRTWP